MNKYTFIAILILTSNIVMAGEWHAVGDVKININIKSIEERLWHYLGKTSSVKFKPRKMYTYQYTSKNKNRIYINALCNTWNRKNLNKELLLVRDGGSCYFKIYYNLNNKQFSELYVNGDA